MKKQLLAALIVTLCILFAVSCSKNLPAGPENDADSETGNETLTEVISQSTPVQGEESPSAPLPSDKDEQMEPCVEPYVFTSLEDFKRYCTTGSTDWKTYDHQTEDSYFPHFRMSDTAFIDVYELFPSWNRDRITVRHIEVWSSAEYTLGCRTEQDQTDVTIGIRFLKDPAAFGQSTDELPVIPVDYFSATEEQKASATLLGFLSEQDGCCVLYRVFKGKVSGVTILCGNCTISFGPSKSEDPGFFADGDLNPLSAMFDESRRHDTLKTIKAFFDSRK